MSEMTAIRVAIVGTVTALLLAVGALLGQTSVPELDRPHVQAGAIFGDHTLARNARYDYVLSALWALGVLVLVAALALASRVAPRARLPVLVQAALAGGGVFVFAWLVRLPFHLAGHWWRRRYDVTEL